MTIGLEAGLIAAGKATAGPAFQLIKSIGPDVYARLRARFPGAFEGHVTAVRERCSKIKNVLYRDESVELKSQYVHIHFGQEEESKVPDLEALENGISGTKYLISGTAGAGKTMFMRWAALSLINGLPKHGRIPLFVELRYVDDDSTKDTLEAFLFSRTSSVTDAPLFDTFKEGLRCGAFIVLLDAIDEVRPSLRLKMLNRITNFMRDYPKCGMIVSSRPDEKIESVQDFAVLRTAPMTRDQIIEVITKLEWDIEIKAKLIARLEEGLYEQLSEFLSNPLLATIMLLAFSHSGDIPTKLTAFYQQAFDALYQRHDAAKGAYKREQHAGLPMDRFESLFATFSFQTYMNFKLEFSDSELLLSFREACEYNREIADPQNVVADCLESICLLQREGLDIVFSHRSFQEYFCALFISRYRESDVGKLIEAVASLEHRSNVLRMLYQISPESLEYEWILPILDSFIEKFGKVRPDTKTGLSRIFRSLFNELIVDLSDGEVAYIGWSGSLRKSEPGHFGRLFSLIESVTAHKIGVYSALNIQLWESLENFLQSVPEAIRPSKETVEERLAHVGAEQPKQEFVIEAGDADWLIYSDLPKLFKDIQAKARAYRDEIVAKRSARGASVKSLLQVRRRARVRYS